AKITLAGEGTEVFSSYLASFATIVFLNSVDYSRRPIGTLDSLAPSMKRTPLERNCSAFSRFPQPRAAKAAILESVFRCRGWRGSEKHSFYRALARNLCLTTEV
ncbi:MAG: hypothetical protein JW892_07165, partial [Anaerolineae bacterium]|nr:hypothetical protein [Anaerolineae bacterium]